MSYRFFCVHGHFYQPPREDALTSEIPVEPGATPYENWNERINAHCYRPNAALNNFRRISFDLGPTLAAWLEDFDITTYRRILEQNQYNYERYGVGNAMAQAYNHTILPLSTRLDKITQIAWGKADFEFRFGHSPKGMWLPETAVDIETLEILAENGIEFTILAPWQANARTLDVSHPYRVRLKDGKSICVFFYHQELSTRISFDPASTSNADQFVLKAVLPSYNARWQMADKPQLLLVASDGEVYGHHQPFRDKFLAYLMDGGVMGQAIEVTYPALWLKNYPVEEWMEIVPNTSWSCHHGVMRWQGACGCTPHSEWKSPLRKGLNLVAQLVDEQYMNFMTPFFSDPWQIRHQYIHVLCKRATLRDLIEGLAARKPSLEEKRKMQILLAAQYERQRMFTSCGWFFDDFDRIEPRNNVAYAAQAVWLTELACGVDVSPRVMNILKKVVSPRTGLRADVVFKRALNRARRFQGSPVGQLFLGDLD
ncbi:MAG: DUF3536 domain-containing protein [Anaerolineae bacterium]|nr:DUF3536 domain-containing protein [Anaerolineae bacterium]